MKAIQRTWSIGGILLIASGLIALLADSFRGTALYSATGSTANLVYLVAVVLFAFGLTPAASLVKRKAAGVMSLLILAVLPLLADGVQLWLDVSMNDPSKVGSAVGTTYLVLAFATGVIATTLIARAETWPWPWRWAPLWVFMLQCLVVFAPLLLLVAVGDAEVQSFSAIISALTLIALICKTFGLGILAMVLAAKHAAVAVPIFKSDSAG